MINLKSRVIKDFEKLCDVVGDRIKLIYTIGFKHYDSYSDATHYEKITWRKLNVYTPKYMKEYEADDWCSLGIRTV